MKARKLAEVTRDALASRGFAVMELGQGGAGPNAFEVVEGGEHLVVAVTGGPEISAGETVKAPDDVPGETAEVLGFHSVEGERLAFVKTDQGSPAIVPAKELVRAEGGG